MTTNIIEKKYKKLTIQVALNGFSFCCFDTLNGNILFFNEIFFDPLDKTAESESLLATIFQDYPALKEDYDEILVIHNNTLSTFVPTPLFDEKFLGSYLQYDVKVFETDFFAFDEITNYQMNNVYIPYANINNFLIDQFGSFDYKHAHTILVANLLMASKNNPEKKMFVHTDIEHFEIVVIQNQKLLFYNSFYYKTPEDFLYYILFVAEQLNLNPEEFPLELIGNIDTESDCYKLTYNYIRHISFMNITHLQAKNTFSEIENRKHFMLFSS